MANIKVNSQGSPVVNIPSKIRVGDTLEFNTTGVGREGTIIDWKVPVSGIYMIEVRGAKGANGGSSHNIEGGYGAILSGNIELRAGTDLSILVGQMGTQYSERAGGGGGSFVWIKDDISEPLIAAGGGGGAGDSSRRGMDATTSTTSTLSGSGTGIAGTDGSGGQTTHGGARAGAGAGWKTSGTGSTSHTLQNGTAIIDGGFGGYSGRTDIYTADGGFGGGGADAQYNSTTADNEGGGGGGGYSGAPGGQNSQGDGGGGGGSYISPLFSEIHTSDGKYDGSDTFNGEPITNLDEFNNGEGQVNITLIKSSLLIRYLFDDGEQTYTYREDKGEVEVVGFSPASRLDFLTKGMMPSLEVPREVLEKAFPLGKVKVVRWEYDTDGYYTRFDYSPNNVIRKSNEVDRYTEDVFMFGEGVKPGDGNHLTFTFSGERVIDRVAFSFRGRPFDYKVRHVRIVFDNSEVTLEIPNDTSSVAPKIKYIDIEPVTTTTVKVYPETYWEDGALVGKSNLTFLMIHFLSKLDIAYKFELFVPGDGWREWGIVEERNEKTVPLPVIEEPSKNTGKFHDFYGVPDDYFQVRSLRARVKTIMADTQGEVYESRWALTNYFWYAPYGLPYVVNKDTWRERKTITHNEILEIPLKIEHQQKQQDKVMYYRIENHTTGQVIYNRSEGFKGALEEKIVITDTDVINGDNTIRVSVKDEDGNTTYEEHIVRKYADKGITLLEFGTRYATKGFEFDLSKPTGTDIKFLLSMDGDNWIRYNVSTEIWEQVEVDDIKERGMHVDEMAVLTEKEMETFDGKKMSMLVYMDTTDPWKEPKIDNIRIVYDSNAQVRYFLNVDDAENQWYMYDLKSEKWVLVQRPLDQAYQEYKGNSTEELINLTPDDWAKFPLGDKVTLGMVLYTNDSSRTPIIRSIVLSDVIVASTPIESGELRLFDGYYYSPVLEMENICQWEKIDYDIVFNESNHIVKMEMRTHTGSDWTEWVEITPTTADDLANILPDGYKLQFRLYFSTSDKVSTPKLLPTIHVTYRISSKEILDANVQKLAEDLKQTKISLANLEFKHHSTAIAQRHNLNNIVVENFNDNSEIYGGYNVTFTGSSYRLTDESMGDGEFRMTAIDLPWFAEYVMIHAIQVGDVSYEISFDGVEYKPISLQEKRFVPENADEVHVKVKLLSGGVATPEVDGIAVIY